MPAAQSPVLTLVLAAGTGLPIAEAALPHPPMRPNGVTLFYTDGPQDSELPGLDDPSVTGGELIIRSDDLEPAPGQYDWSRFDYYLAAWMPAGKKLELRLSTAHNHPNNSPVWLYNTAGVCRIGRGG
jgi:hypothetical protein